MRIRVLIATMVGAWLLSSSAASAGLLVYTDQNQWLNSFYASAMEDFEASPLGALAPGTTDIGLFDVTLDLNTAGLSAVQGAGTVNGSRELQLAVDKDAFLWSSQIVLNNFGASPVHGFGATWANATDGEGLRLTAGGQSVDFSAYLGGSGNGFLGIVSLDPITELYLGSEIALPNGWESFAFDNAMLGLAVRPEVVAAAVPLPGAVWLLGAGVAGVLGVARSRV